jgi:threonine-phosphate decarboxylase
VEDRLRFNHGGNLFAICRERGWDWREVLDLSASINPLGPAPGVRPAVEEALDRIAHYPSQPPAEFEALLAGAWGVPPELVMAGGGATELLHFVARAGWNGPAALATPVWSEFYRAFPHALKLPPAEIENWPPRGLLVLSQPVNPTGEEVPSGTIRRAIAAREGPVLIDETFIDFTELEPAAPLCASHPNLLVLRSLSKFHALPGLRVGALIASPGWMARLRKRREPWTVSTPGEAAARAALSDPEHIRRSRELVAQERRWLAERLSGLPGLRLLPGAANFLFAETDRPAAAICDWFLERKILLRNCTGLPGVSGEAIRFAVRTRPENERFAAAAKECFCAAC